LPACSVAGLLKSPTAASATRKFILEIETEVEVQTVVKGRVKVRGSRSKSGSVRFVQYRHGRTRGTWTYRQTKR
jgi:hypothetical protein